MIWWIPLALFVPLFFLWDIVHEGSHALAALVCGRKITSVRLWPHVEPDLGFVFGSVRFTGVNTTFILIMPYFVDVLAAAAFFVSFALVDGNLVRSILATVVVAPIVNTAVAVQARFRGNDRSDLARVHWGWAIPFLHLLLLYMGVFGALVLQWMF